jgi:hypothetical protein
MPSVRLGNRNGENLVAGARKVEAFNGRSAPLAWN